MRAFRLTGAGSKQTPVYAGVRPGQPGAQSAVPHHSRLVRQLGSTIRLTVSSMFRFLRWRALLTFLGFVLVALFIPNFGPDFAFA